MEGLQQFESTPVSRETMQLFSENQTGRNTTTNMGVLFNSITLRRCVSVTLILLFMIIVMSAETASYTDVFLYHPVSMTLVFCGVLPELLYTIALISGGTQHQISRYALIQAHRRFAFTLKLFSAFGIMMIQWSKFSRSKLHFRTWHACIGGVCELSQVLETVLGVALYYGRSDYRFLAAHHRGLRLLHRYLAMVVVTTGLAAMFLGMFSHYAERVFKLGLIRLLFAAMPTVIAIWAYYSAKCL